MLKNGIVMNINLPINIVQKGNLHVASCPDLDVFSQGESREKAKANLKEALFLFLGSCLERGTLHQVLKECGFNQVKSHMPLAHRHRRQKYINVPTILRPKEGYERRAF